MPMPPAPRLLVSEVDRKELVALSRQRGIPRGILLRLNIILGAAQGRANHVLARESLHHCDDRVACRPARSGRPKQISPDKEAAIVEATIRTVPKDATHWSVRATRRSVRQRSFASGKNTSCKPHRVESFKFSNDPDFASQGPGHRGFVPESAGKGHHAERG